MGSVLRGDRRMIVEAQKPCAYVDLRIWSLGGAVYLVGMETCTSCRPVRFAFSLAPLCLAA